MNIRLKRYRKDYSYSYTNGVFSTIELLDGHPEHVHRIIISSSGEGNEGILKIRRRCKDYDIPVEVNDKIMERISLKGKHLAIGVFSKYQSPIELGKNHMALVNPSDMGNIGTIARTMVGFGMFNLVLIRPAADYFDPRVIRASMGAIFHLNIEYFDRITDYQKAYKNNLYFFKTGENGNIREIDFHEPYSLVFGNESAGLPDDMEMEGKYVFIPQTGKIDSLNLSVAAGIALYESSKH